MAVSDFYDVDTSGTATNDTLTYTTDSGTGGTWSSTSTIAIYDPQPQIQIRDPYAGSIKQSAKELFKEKDFWDGVEWEEHTSYMPRKSITGKIIIGKMYKRWRTPEPKYRGQGLGVSKQFAKKKELFQEKLKGEA